jgi:hypothetical protein
MWVLSCRRNLGEECALQLLVNVSPFIYAYLMHDWFRNLSFTIKCMRALVFDSKSEFGATFQIGQNAEDHDADEISSGVVVWGDVCVDFFKYKNKSIDSHKKHLFFLTFHTAFYVEQRNLYFGKSKLDKLCKDSKNKLCDPEFSLSLCFDLPEPSNQKSNPLKAPSLKSLMKQCGTAVHFAPGEILQEENTPEVNHVPCLFFLKLYHLTYCNRKWCSS